MIKEAYEKGIQEAYFNFLKENPKVKEALYKEAANVSPWVAAGGGLLAGTGLGAGAYHLIKRRQEAIERAKAEEALNQALMEQYASYPSYYF